LADVAPFVLKVMGLPVPKCMRQALKVTWKMVNLHLKSS
jgi:hypothetical protein